MRVVERQTLAHRARVIAEVKTIGSKPGSGIALSAVNTGAPTFVSDRVGSFQSSNTA